MTLTDGIGNFYKAVISATGGKRCQVKVTETIPQEKGWNGYLHVAMAPTKNMDRTEWFVAGDYSVFRRTFAIGR